MTRETAIKKCMALYQLALRGEGGEAANAQRLLEGLCNKFGILREEYDPGQPQERVVNRITEEMYQVFVNFCASIAGKDVEILKCNGKGYYRVVLNEHQWNTFQDKWPRYRSQMKKEAKKLWESYLKQQKMLASAFISKHNLYPTDVTAASNRQLTTEELDEIIEILRMREKLEDVHFYTKLPQHNG